MHGVRFSMNTFALFLRVQRELSVKRLFMDKLEAEQNNRQDRSQYLRLRAGLLGDCM